MVFRISRLRAVAADDVGFSDLVSALPDGAEICLYSSKGEDQAPSAVSGPSNFVAACAIGAERHSHTRVHA
jgi:hypothetical protein